MNRWMWYAMRLRIMQRCDDGYTAPILTHAESKNKRIRASALAALAKHASDDAERWFERGLKDPETCVRMEVARLLPMLDIELSTKRSSTLHDTIQILLLSAVLKSNIRINVKRGGMNYQRKIIFALALLVEFAWDRNALATYFWKEITPQDSGNFSMQST